MENETLATEMLREIKAQTKRWFIISIILLVALVGSIVDWLLHEGQYETFLTDKSIEQEQKDTQKSSMSGVIN